MELTTSYHEALYHLLRLNANPTLLFVLELATTELIDAIRADEVPAERVFFFEQEPLHIIE